MNIIIKCKLDMPENLIMQLVDSLIRNRPPKDGGLDYGLETHGAIGVTIGYGLNYPIVVKQTNKRKNKNSPIQITIEKHIPLF